jgi:uncharacterized membrane protein YphA (DoxX/SURF4 family)
MNMITMLKRRIADYLLILISIVAAWFIFRSPGLNYLLLTAFTIATVLSLLIRKPGGLLLIVSRVLLGVVFIFSGYVKLVDPLGFQYKIEDYLQAMELYGLEPYALVFALILSISEMLIGLGLLFKVRMRVVAWGLALFMGIFLPLTLWLAVSDAVKDCGCFGDALVLSNWQTFYKNLLFLPFTLVVFIHRKRYGWFLNPLLQWGLAGLFLILSIGLSGWCMRHEPIHDFRAWKVGSDIYKPQAPTVYLVYKNTLTGETDQWLSSELPWQDSLWVKQWVFVESRIDKDFNPESNYIPMSDEYGEDQGVAILHNPDYQLIVISYDVLKGKSEAFDDLNEIYVAAEKDGIAMVGATSSIVDELEPFRHQKQIMYPFYWSDDITLKTVLRSNPGLMLLKGGRILAKWHYNDLPTYDELKEDYLQPAQ